MMTEMPKGKRAVVSRHTKSLAHGIVSFPLSDRQVKCKSDTVRHYHEVPAKLGIGIAIRQAIRGKKILNLLHGLGVSVVHERLQKLKTQKVNTVLQDER